jgi:putative tricarboxylic transport membrane protein
MPITPANALRVAAPLCAALAAAIVARYFIAPGVDVDGMARGLAGPATWPKTMLYCAAACAALIGLRALYSLRRQAVPAAPGSGYDDAKLLAGMALLVLYGYGITQIGMAWATVAFIAAWLLISGLRRPLPVLLVSTLGTIAILYVFVKISLMPLDRGRGVFEQATILLYQLLGIF